jgi:Fur family ferric uptake transcriptional regulator
MENLLERLHEKGLRATSQRVLLLEILDSGQHLDAEAVYQQARQRDPDISLATVYRTLERLETSGLVAQRYFGRDHKREVYESAAKQEHYHFKCVSCGTLIEVQTRRIAQMRQELAQDLGVLLQHACFCLEGLCKDCVEKGKTIPANGMRFNFKENV